MKFILASDHGGFALKEEIKRYLESKAMLYDDLGCHSEESVSYADFGKKLAKSVKTSTVPTLGIGVCGSGIGISISVNRTKGIRGALIRSAEDAMLAKQHNNANILLFGGRVTSADRAIKWIQVFLNEKYEGGRHNLRVEGLDK